MMAFHHQTSRTESRAAKSQLETNKPGLKTNERLSTLQYILFIQSSLFGLLTEITK